MRFVTTAISGIALSAGAVLGTETSVPFINADDVHAQGITGRGVTVAVIDTGIDYGDAGLMGDIRPGGISIIDGEYIGDGGAALQPFSHGTRMSLIITDPTGVAPNAYVLPVRVFDAADDFEPDDVIEAIRYVIERRQVDRSIRVINLSLYQVLAYYCSCDEDLQELADAVSDAAAAGIVTFAMTGNNAFCVMIRAPACVSGAVRVAANYDADYGLQTYPSLCTDPATPPYRVTCFSNIAADCDYLLAAPGYDITVGTFNIPDLWGTSDSVAHCSGVAALMFEKNICGSLDAYSARSTIFNTATEYEWGSPYCALPPQPWHVNALAAVNAVAAGSCSATPGDLDCDGTVSLVDFTLFLECLLGPGAGPATGWCDCADFAGSRSDGDVDLRDFAEFQVAFTGYGTGACCHADGSCTEGTVHECDAAGGFYQGHDTTCATAECPVPNWGACCQAGGSCAEETVEDCIWGEGLYLGDGTQCASVDCPTVAYQNFVHNSGSPTYTTCDAGLALADDMTLASGCSNGLVYYDLTVYGGGVGSETFDATVSLHTGWPPTGANQIDGTEFTWTDLPDGPSPAHLHAVMDPPVTIPDTVWMKAEFSDQNAGWFIGGTAEIGSTEDYFGRYDPPSWTLYWWEGDPHAGLWATLGCVEP